eukprot:10245600-Ditylum_brightwellii.AAC.1
MAGERWVGCEASLARVLYLTGRKNVEETRWWCRNSMVCHQRRAAARLSTLTLSQWALEREVKLLAPLL